MTHEVKPDLHDPIADVSTEDSVPDLHKPEVVEITVDELERDEGLLVNISKQLLHLAQQIYKQGLWLTLVEAVDQLVRIIAGAPTSRFSHIAPGLHVGGQFFKHGWPELRSRGITAVVNMRKEHDDARAGIAPSRYLYLPTRDNTAPSLEHLHQGIEFIQSEIESGGQVYVHCWEGVGRAPTMAAAYLVSQGMTPNEAWAKIESVRPFIRPSIGQIKRLEQFAKQVREAQNG